MRFLAKVTFLSIMSDFLDHLFSSASSFHKVYLNIGVMLDTSLIPFSHTFCLSVVSILCLSNSFKLSNFLRFLTSHSFILYFFCQSKKFSATNGPVVRHIMQPCLLMWHYVLMCSSFYHPACPDGSQQAFIY